MSWVGKFRLGMAAPEGTAREGRLASTHAYIILKSPDGDTWMHTWNNPNPIMLCGIQETVGWEDEGEQTGGEPTCRRCQKAIAKRLRKLDAQAGQRPAESSQTSAERCSSLCLGAKSTSSRSNISTPGGSQ